MASRYDPAILPQYSQRSQASPSAARTVLRYTALALLGAGYGLLMVFLPAQLIVIPAVPLIVMLALILWKLPDLGTYPERTIDRFYFAYLVLLVLWPPYIVINLPGLPWLGLERIALFGLTLTMLYALATSSELRRQTATVAGASKPVLTMLLVFITMQFITLPFAPELPNALKRTADAQFSLTVVFFVSCFVLSKPGYPTRFAKTLLIVAMIMGVIAIAETFKREVLWANSIPSFLKVEGEYLNRVLSAQGRYGDTIYRTRGSFTVSLVLAEFMVIATPFLLNAIATAKGLGARVLLMLGWVMVGAVIIFTDSHLGIVGFLAAHFMYGGIWALRRWRQGKRDLLASAIVYGFPVILLIFVAALASSHTLYTSIFGGGGHQMSVDARKTQRDMAIPLVLKNPIGHGTAQSGAVLQFRGPSGTLTVDSHFITTLLDYGIIGFISFYGMILTASWIGVKLFLQAKDEEAALAGPAAVVLAVFVVGKMVLSQEDNHSLLFMIIALVMALKAHADGLISGRPVARHH